MRKRVNPKVGLALGGGGARGGVHIGVLKALEAHEIPIHCISGTSIGSLIGGMYAFTLSARAVEQRLLEYLDSETFKNTRFNFVSEASSQGRSGLLTRISSFLKKEFLLTLALSRPYLISKERFRENLDFFLPDVRIEDARIPFAAMATDMETGEEVLIRSGPLIDAVYASCTYPGVLEAVRINGRLLADGGVICNVPVFAARALGADVVIAVNIERDIQLSIDGLSGIEMLFRADDIMGAELTRCKTRGADILIHPRLGEERWYDFLKTPSYIPIGETAAAEKIPEIQRVMKQRRGGYFLQRIFPSSPRTEG